MTSRTYVRQTYRSAPAVSPGDVVVSSKLVTRAAPILAPRGSSLSTGAPPDRPAARGAIGARASPWRRTWPYLLAFGAYLVIALAAWWHLLSGDFGAALPTGSADAGQEVWFLAWLPHALGTGSNPFFSRAIFSSSGVNLLDNTSMDLLGLLLAPVTVTAGPVASLDLAVVLAPALSALGAFALSRRYVSWSPAAFAGGLCYGFGPFLTGDLRYGHLDLTWLVLPPLILCCLDALLVRGTDRPLFMGGVLGALVTAQFFVSTELLALSALTIAVTAVIVSLGWPRAVLPRLAAAWRGLAVAAGIVVLTLAYPFWVIVAGPHHIVGAVWRHIGGIATSLAATVEPHAELAGVAFISGSNGSYLGAALLAVLLFGGVVLWRSGVLRVALLTALVAYVASLGYRLHVGHQALHVALPAAVLGHIPLLDSIVPERFAAMVDLFCGLALAVILDHLRAWERPRTLAGPRTATAALPRPSTPLLVGLAVSVGAFALVPLATLPQWPYAVAASPRPAAFVRPLPADPVADGRPTPVVAIYPDTSSWVSKEMIWQAEDGFSFTLPDGYAIVPGPDGQAVESPPTNALWLVFAAGSLQRLHLPLARTTRVALVGDLHVLGIDDVVVLPDAPGSEAVRRALGETLGRPLRAPDGAAVWHVGVAPS
jgi:hypothetical protein